MKKEESVIEIEINITGQSHFVDELSNLIQLKPTSFWKKGDLRHFSKHVRVTNPKALYYQNTVWNYGTGRVPVSHFKEVFGMIKNRFDDKYRKMINFSQENNLGFRFEIIIIENHINVPVRFDRECLAWIKKLGIGVDIDIYRNVVDDKFCESSSIELVLNVYEEKEAGKIEIYKFTTGKINNMLFEEICNTYLYDGVTKEMNGLRTCVQEREVSVLFQIFVKMHDDCTSGIYFDEKFLLYVNTLQAEVELILE